MRSTAVSQPMLRRLAGALAAGAALAASSGCSVPVDAVAGISVTDDGHLLGVLMVCGHHIDGATLYVDSNDPDRQMTAGSWTADNPLTTGLTTWTLDSPSVGWDTTTSLTPLAAATTYTLYGWTADNSWSSRHVSFTLLELNRLAPGTVRFDDVSADGDERATTVPLAKFKARACQNG